MYSECSVLSFQLDAAVAYELARDCFSEFKNNDDPTPEELKRNIDRMRQVAFSFLSNPLQMPSEANAKTKPNAKPKPAAPEPEPEQKTRNLRRSKRAYEAPFEQPVTKRARKETEEEEAAAEFGSVGWKFKKQFDGVWYDGVVVEVLETKYRRCHYPADGDFEDLNLDDLAKLDKGEATESQSQAIEHNDLCEACGEVGELLCCSTCNLVFHMGCVRPKLAEEVADDWSCAYCISESKQATQKEKQVARRAVQDIEAVKEEVRRKAQSRKSPRKRSLTTTR